MIWSLWIAGHFLSMNQLGQFSVIVGDTFSSRQNSAAPCCSYPGGFPHTAQPLLGMARSAAIGLIQTIRSPAGVPASGDTIVFNGGAITLTAPFTCNGQFNWSGGTLSGNPLTIGSNGVLNILGNVSLVDALINYGTANWQAGTVTKSTLFRQRWLVRDLEQEAGALWNIQC